MLPVSTDLKPQLLESWDEEGKAEISLSYPSCWREKEEMRKLSPDASKPRDQENPKDIIF